MSETDPERSEDNLFHVAPAEQLQEEGRAIITVEGREIAVFPIEGDFYAVANFCPHQAGPLCEGPRSGKLTVTDDWEWKYVDSDEVIRCPWHGYGFDIKTGETTAELNYRTPIYDVRTVDGEVYIEL